MTMTRKDYRMVAVVIEGQKRSVERSRQDELLRLRRTAESMAAMFSLNFTNFKAQEFLKACGFNDEKEETDNANSEA